MHVFQSMNNYLLPQNCNFHGKRCNNLGKLRENQRHLCGVHLISAAISQHNSAVLNNVWHRTLHVYLLWEIVRCCLHCLLRYIFPNYMHRYDGDILNVTLQLIADGNETYIFRFPTVGKTLLQNHNRMVKFISNYDQS